MIVVTIVGILAAVAVPTYQDYSIRTQITEGINYASLAQKAVGDFYSNRGRLPPNNASAGLSSATSLSGSYVKQIRVNNGMVEIQYGNRANAHIGGVNNTLALNPYGNASGQIVWLCGFATPADAATSQSNLGPTSPPANSTNLALKYMPGNCR